MYAARVLWYHSANLPCYPTEVPVAMELMRFGRVRHINPMSVKREQQHTHEHENNTAIKSLKLTTPGGVVVAQRHTQPPYNWYPGWPRWPIGSQQLSTVNVLTGTDGIGFSSGVIVISDTSTWVLL